MFTSNPQTTTMRTILNRLSVLSLLLLIISTAQAQQRWWLGGFVSFTNYNSSHEVHSPNDNELIYSSDHNNTNFNIAPVIGYDLTDHWAVALKVGYNRTDVETLSDRNAGTKEKSTESNDGLTISPMVRWTFAEWQKLRFHVDALAEYRRMMRDRDSSSTDYHASTNTFSFGFVPGVSYPLTSRLYVTASLGSLMYSTGDDINDPEIRINRFSFSLWSDLSLGFYIKF